MEQQKIGRFINELRKEKELTQKQLADKIGVSDKTVSKWETGRGMPDTAIMSELCRELGISINELLSGEKLSVDNYNGKAEENMVHLLKNTEMQKEKQKWSVMNIVLSLLWLLLFVLLVVILGMGSPDLIWFLDTPSLILVMGFMILGLGIGGQMKYFWLGIKAAYIRDEKKAGSKETLEKAEYALGYGIKIILLSGIMAVMISLVTIIGNLQEPSELGPNLAVAILTILYGIVFSIILYVFKARVHNLITEKR